MKKFTMFALTAALAIPAFAQQAPSRVAVIDVRKVLADSAQGKQAFDRMKKMQEERAGRVQKMDEELKALDTQINQKKISLSDDKLVELQKQFSDKKIGLQRFAQDAERELTEARDRSLADLEKQILPVINQIGKEMGFAAIFNKYESGLVFASDAIDITDVVVKRFNEMAKPAAAPAPAPKPK